MKSIIFSYNRACQLDLLIRSHKKFWGEDIVVSYMYSDDYFRAGYNKVRTRHPDVKFIHRVSLKEDILNEMTGEYTVFFCDDEIMIRPFSEEDTEFRIFTNDQFSYLCMYEFIYKGEK